METCKEYENGIAFYEKGNYGEAIECFEMVAELNPSEELKLKLSEAYYNLGMDDDYVFYEDNPCKADRCFEKALELNPAEELRLKLADFYYTTGKDGMYYHKDNFYLVTRCYEKVLELNPKYADKLTEAYIEMGEYFLDDDDFDKTIKCCKKLLKLNPSNAKAYFLMGEAYEYLYKEPYKAFEFYDKAIELDQSLIKRYYDVVINYCEYRYEYTSDYDTAIELYNKVIKLDSCYEEKLRPKLAKAYYDRGEAYGYEGDKGKESEYKNKAKELGYDEDQANE